MLINLLNISPRVSFDISPRVSSQRACRASISARDKSRHLSGSIPSEWGLLPLVNITLLGNRLTGPIPKEIGNIITLERLVLENNQLSGTLPPELGRLSNLKRLVLYASGLSGPIPLSIAHLTKLKDLMISDMTGPEFFFPPLQSMTQMRQLVLRNINLKGELPSYLGTNTTNLTLL
ncbi:Leucine-rich repeat (LRR) family protein [Arabidopsis thaliana]|uniref:Leucine-rich repeat (LRR) family protein n=3 Tax=Arabidopsis TaxID=3701 RepID=F4JLP8_ARATH|nr:Leucine-rich repeat (LRR) family protein [Arabidopsis thaliana]NP_001154240.1 Leucine-rich repeat (LRR) family protein [Arabidopsis thaliana]AEE83707.1 Leucine-rich repeat (LRR) family protein [Arabidopsis thaliana]AEE83708.1 Leucine-rich repeat (LRR) family protein [Arabidopsis thaliana]|eukprot:NP_001031649.2 Leucine-rich repeat (LRR) family protein [Arabidopsis thaliana]